MILAGMDAIFAIASITGCNCKIASCYRRKILYAIAKIASITARIIAYLIYYYSYYYSIKLIKFLFQLWVEKVKDVNDLCSLLHYI